MQSGRATQRLQAQKEWGVVFLNPRGICRGCPVTEIVHIHLHTHFSQFTDAVLINKKQSAKKL